MIERCSFSPGVNGVDMDGAFGEVRLTLSKCPLDSQGFSPPWKNSDQHFQSKSVLDK